MNRTRRVRRLGGLAVSAAAPAIDPVMPAMTGKDSCRAIASTAPTAALITGTSVSRASTSEAESVLKMTMFPNYAVRLIIASYYPKVLRKEYYDTLLNKKNKKGG